MTYAWTELAAVDANGESSSDALASQVSFALSELEIHQW